MLKLDGLRLQLSPPDLVRAAASRRWWRPTSRARIAHDFAYGEPQHDGRGGHRLATPVAVMGADTEAHDDLAPQAAVYLNPHFEEAALADGLERGLADARAPAHLIGEGYAQRAAQMGLHHRIVVWQGRTEDFARAVTTAASELLALANDGNGPQAAQKGSEAAIARLQHWTVLLQGSGEQWNSKPT